MSTSSSASSSSNTNNQIQTDSAENVIRKAKFDNDLSSSNSISELNLPPTSQSILSIYSNPSTLHPLSNLNSNQHLDYLTLDDSQLSSIAGSQTVLPNRGWSDELCYGTGTVYVTGLILGGFWGAKDGWSRSQVIAADRLAKSIPISTNPSSTAPSGININLAPNPNPSPNPNPNPNPTASGHIKTGPASAAYSGAVGSGVSWRLRLNSILNGITRRGSFVGNTSGVLALMYNVFNCTLDRYRGQHDNWNSILAGGLTGALFRCTAGPQKMFIATSLMAAGAMGWSTIKPRLI